MKIDYDVIIIGAGPAGISCSWELNKHNISNIIIEKKNFENKNKTCDGLISLRAKKFLNELKYNIPSSICCENSKLKIKISNRGTFFLDIQEDEEYLNTERSNFDKWLIGLENINISYNSFYMTHMEKNSYIEVNIKKDNVVKKYTCKYLIGSDGGLSKVRKLIQENYKSIPYVISKQFIFKIENTSINPNFYYFIMGKKFTDVISGFCFKGEKFIFNTSSYKKYGFKEYIDYYFSYFKKQYNIILGNPIKISTCLLEEQPHKNIFLGGKNILLTGEAAGLMTSLGEGISSAFISGRLAANAIYKSYLEGKSASIIYNEFMSEEKKYILKTWDF